jgi:acetylornithine deacetylase/succinyl-diaminopimelate desuccinylase-like protein
LIQQLDSDLILNYLEALVSFGPRVTTTEECDEAAAYIFNEYNSMGYDVRYHNWSADSIFGSNVEATLHGIDPNSDEIYIVLAHYDTVYDSPGADDDGSGTVAAMAIAYLFKDLAFNHTIKFLAVSGEEQGLWGSSFYAYEAYERGDNIVAVINADMIGYAVTDTDKTHVNVYDDEDQSIWITDIAIDISTLYYDYIGVDINPLGYTWASDHSSFWQNGFNAIFYAESHFNPHWHQPEDTIENMDLTYCSNVSQLILATLATLAEPVNIQKPDKPVITSGEVNGEIDNSYDYTAIAIDPQGDDVYLLFDWGDDTDSDWLGPYLSGEEIKATHSWSSRGSYKIKVKAKDDQGHESEWSDPYPVSMPHNRLISLMEKIEELLFDFPVILQIILSLFRLK